MNTTNTALSEAGPDSIGPDYIQIAIGRFENNAATADDSIMATWFQGMADAIRALSAQKVTLQHHATDLSNCVRHAGAVLSDRCHGAASAAGWWTDLKTGEPVIDRQHVVGEKLMLIVSEVSEAMQGHRKGLMDDKLPHRKMIEVELADAVIRIGDLAGALGLDLGGAIEEKMAFNAQRPDHKPEARMAAGGKAY